MLHQCVLGQAQASMVRCAQASTYLQCRPATLGRLSNYQFRLQQHLPWPYPGSSRQRGGSCISNFPSYYQYQQIEQGITYSFKRLTNGRERWSKVGSKCKIIETGDRYLTLFSS